MQNCKTALEVHLVQKSGEKIQRRREMIIIDRIDRTSEKIQRRREMHNDPTSRNHA